MEKILTVQVENFQNIRKEGAYEYLLLDLVLWGF